MTLKELDGYIKKYIRGDKDSFDVIYYETQTSVYLSIYFIIKNKDIIEDLMQDTYMKVIESIHMYKVGTNFKAWISRIARNIAINEYNKRKKVELLEDASHYTFNDIVSNNHVSKFHNMIKLLEGLEKEVVVYHLVLNMKFKEIALIIDKPLSTVFSLYKKAIKFIKEEYVDYEN